MFLSFPALLLFRHFLRHCDRVDRSSQQYLRRSARRFTLWFFVQKRTFTGYEPNSWIDVSSECTPVHYPSQDTGFYTKSEHSLTVLSSENLNSFPKHAAASSSQHVDVKATGNLSRKILLTSLVGHSRLSAYCESIGTPIASDSISRISQMWSREKRDRNLDCVETQSGRQTLYLLGTES